MRPIDADELRDKLTSICSDKANDYNKAVKAFIEFIDNAPTVDVIPNKEGYEMYNKGYMSGYEKGKEERPQGEWIPVKYRPLTEEQRIAFAEHYGIEYCDTANEKAFDCSLPEDGQEILISTSWGIRLDVAANDIDGDGFICYGLEENGDWDGVDAWMPLPQAYKEAENERK